ncbi:MAG: hypothetical protein KBG28_06990 [Kofleriaceae bacterium]|nr:hypothetical protein [Kofleriaceae bacterium]MBP6837192.1 hypothetical protein [Kofleriaceae bacterium]MBP9203689.1 hypothetical protein [Kofleriaceae bacterium]
MATGVGSSPDFFCKSGAFRVGVRRSTTWMIGSDFRETASDFFTRTSR